MESMRVTEQCGYHRCRDTVADLLVKPQSAAKFDDMLIDIFIEASINIAAIGDLKLRCSV